MKQTIRKVFLAAGILTATLLTTATLSGCASQIAALKPVSGDKIAGVRAAAIDVLIAQDFQILEAPQCAQDDVAITCTGLTMDKSVISVSSPLDPPGNFTVTVADKTVFEGSIADVLTQAAGG